MRIMLTLCAIGVLVLALGVLTAGGDVWLLDLPTFFWPVVTIGAVVLLLLCLAWGGRVATLAALLAVVLCAVPFVLLPAAPDGQPGEKVRILTANLYVDNPDPRPLVALLIRAQPDIVITEETRPGFADAIRGSGLYPFESDIDLASADDKKVFSRYPVRNAEQIKSLPGKRSPRHAMRLVVDLPFGPIVVYAVHADTPRSLEQWRMRSLYFEQLALAIRAEAPNTPVVVAGDWNMPAYSALFRDFFAQTGYRFARPGYWLPITRFNTRLARFGYFGSTIDHVAVSPDVRMTGWQLGEDIGSNHLPVIVDLALPSSKALASR